LRFNPLFPCNDFIKIYSIFLGSSLCLGVFNVGLMTTKYTKQKYTEKQTRLGAKRIKGAYEEIRTDTQLAKKKARTFSNIIVGSKLPSHKKNQEEPFIQEFIPFHKGKKKKRTHRKKK